jgi:diadenosine tetraphosphate (Ap4A) HIT family hydrolase
VSDCIFCAIVAGAAEASFVYQDDAVVAFMDLRPVTPGHLLVIPRVHATGLAELDAGTGSRVWQAAQPIAAALRTSGLRCDGVNLFLADGEAAGQEVFHVHLHVVPRFAGDGFRIQAAWQFPPRSALDEHASAIRSQLA